MNPASAARPLLFLCGCLLLGPAIRAQSPDPGMNVWLFSTFHEPAQDGLRFAFSYDGYGWTNVPGVFLKPRVGGKLMRDPCLQRGPDGTYHLVWTSAWRGDRGFGYAHSKDLVHWSEQQFIPVMAHEPNARNVWAPELFYDENESRWIVCWASAVTNEPPANDDEPVPQRLYCATTRDFVSFTPARVLFDPGFSVIDGAIVRDGAGYLLLFKNNTRPDSNLRVTFGSSPLGPWTGMAEPFTPSGTEGPAALRIGGDWLIYFDEYRARSYGAVKTRDFKTFTPLTNAVSFPAGHKHGTALAVPQRDLNRLLRAGAEQMPGLRLPFASRLDAADIAQRLRAIDAVANAGPFKPDWASLTNFHAPQWYRDAKFGVFIHWGAYSVPAFGNEWYPRNMYRTNSPEYAHHLAAWGPHAKFGYKDFIPLFKAEHFHPADWARLFKDAGAKYVLPVAEHHDGFPMYDSDLTEWTAAKKGPQRDVLGELATALRREKIVFGTSSHRAEHWWFFDQGLKFDSDVRDTNNAALYGPASSQRVAESQAEPPDAAFLDDWLLRCCEIVDKYHPQLLYFDWWIAQPVFQPYLKRFAAYYYNRGAQWNLPVAINFKEWEGTSFPTGAGVFDVERGQFADIRPDFWQTDTSVSRTSWGYIANQSYKDAGSIIDDLVDIVSKNGTLLLNIGPKHDGAIPEAERRILLETGGWLKINGEAIYATRPWVLFGEGPTRVQAGSFTDTHRHPFTAHDIRFTTRNDTLYAIALAWPEDGKLTVKSLATGSPLVRGKINRVQVLGLDRGTRWERTADGLTVALPPEPISPHAVTLKIAGLTVQSAPAKTQPQ